MPVHACPGGHTPRGPEHVRVQTPDDSETPPTLCWNRHTPCCSASFNYYISNGRVPNGLRLVFLPPTPRPRCSLLSHRRQFNMIKQLIYLLFSTGFSGDTPSDDDFFNEPSTLRPRLTAAAATKEGPPRMLRHHLPRPLSITSSQKASRGPESTMPLPALDVLIESDMSCLSTAGSINRGHARRCIL